jgi:hypothetical protein
MSIPQSAAPQRPAKSSERAIAAATAPCDFLDWLAVATVTDDPPGDLIDDLRRDTRKPADIPSRAELRRYLRLRRACREALRTVPAVWRRFEAGESVG